MPGRKRSDLGTTYAIAKRRLRVEELMVEGVRSSYAIADRLRREAIKIDARTVQRDIQATAALLAEEAKVIRVELVAGCRWRQRNAREEFERSRQDRERTRVKTKGGKPTGKGQAAPGESEITVEGRIAQVAFLREDRENGAEIARLVGAYAPSEPKHKHGGDPETPPIVQVTYDPKMVEQYRAAMLEWARVCLPEALGEVREDGAADSQQASA